MRVYGHRLTQHIRFVPDDIHPFFCFEKKLFLCWGRAGDNGLEKKKIDENLEI